VENGSHHEPVFRGSSVSDTGSYLSVPVLVEIGSGSIGQLDIESLTSAQITAPLSSDQFERIDSVYGAGVLATGWEFPNAVMAYEVPSISASTGQPSIKIGKIVEPHG
jgi:hypothetical protein